MTEFGETLRELRKRHGWRQQDLVDALSGQIARSTIANIETGREPPTARLWELIQLLGAEWATTLEGAYLGGRSEVVSKQSSGITGVQSPRRAQHEHDTSRAWSLGGPYIIEMLQLIYVFRHSRSPEEIIETRRVRATANGADGYGLKLSNTETEGFRVDEEVLWGGAVVERQHSDGGGRTVYHRRIDFGRRLRRGQVHEFAVRSWIERDPEPCTDVQATFSIPCKSLAIHLNFLGPDQPEACWQNGPTIDDIHIPRESTLGHPLGIERGRPVSVTFSPIEPGTSYGISWRW